MKKTISLLFIFCSIFVAPATGLATSTLSPFVKPVEFISPTGYTSLNPSEVSMDTLRNKVSPITSQRRVVSRSSGTSARSATNINTISSADNPSSSGRSVVARRGSYAVQSTNTARSGSVIASSNNNSSTGRKVIARGSSDNARSAATYSSIRSSRGDASMYYQNSETSSNNSLAVASNVSPQQCMTDYTSCMDDYCERSNTKYDRCYCSARLATLDAEYQPAIEELIKNIAIAENGNSEMTEAEQEEFWQNTFSQYYDGNNSLANLNDAVSSIDWSSTESRVRGQNAFAVGHEYCVQHLQGCFSLAESMRGVYRSSISRDCATYENYLKTIKSAAEVVLESYQ